jgi:hypothetical protein
MSRNVAECQGGWERKTNPNAIRHDATKSTRRPEIASFLRVFVVNSKLNLQKQTQFHRRGRERDLPQLTPVDLS